MARLQLLYPAGNLDWPLEHGEGSLVLALSRHLNNVLRRSCPHGANARVSASPGLSTKFANCHNSLQVC